MDSPSQEGPEHYPSLRPAPGCFLGRAPTVWKYFLTQYLKLKKACFLFRNKIETHRPVAFLGKLLPASCVLGQPPGWGQGHGDTLARPKLERKDPKAPGEHPGVRATWLSALFWGSTQGAARKGEAV